MIALENLIRVERKKEPGVYKAYAQAIDDFVWNDEDFLVIHSVGNEGLDLGPQSIREEPSAKNVISVGATENGDAWNHLFAASSRGPTADGRLKPSLLVPGSGVVSAKSQLELGCTEVSANYQRCSGTSFATGILAGAAAQVRQYYMEGWYPTATKKSSDAFTPTAALIRATLINGAQEISGTFAYEYDQSYPNNDQGWGLLNLENVLFPPDGDLWLHQDNHIYQGQTAYYELDIDPGRPFEVTLAWTDPPGGSGCDQAGGKCIVNDLDLKVTAPTGDVFKGNVFSGYNPGESTTGGSYDRTNVEEGVLILNPVDGVYKVEVIAHNVPFDPTRYGLVGTFKLDPGDDDGGGGGGGSTGSPFVAPWNGTEYEVDNNILPLSEVVDREEQDTSDHYRLHVPLVIKNGAYSLKLIEFEHEHSYLDSVELWTVDHDPDASLGVHHQTGGLLTFEEAEPPDSAADNYGRDVLPSLAAWDGTTYTGWHGDYVVLEFGEVPAGEARLVVVADPDHIQMKTRLLVEVWNGTGWQWVDSLHHRLNFAHEVVDLTPVLPSDDLRVRLVGISEFTLEQAGLDTSPQKPFVVHEAPLLSAAHSSGSDVTELLTESDDAYGELVPGEDILLEFGTPNVTDPDLARSFVLVSEGHYIHKYQPFQGTDVTIDGLTATLEAIVPDAPLGIHWEIEIESLTWNLGDETTATGERVIHAYSEPGDYLVTIQIAYADGHLTQYQRRILLSG